MKIPNANYSKSKIFKYNKKNLPWNTFIKTGDDEYRAKVDLKFEFSELQATT